LVNLAILTTLLSGTMAKRHMLVFCQALPAHSHTKIEPIPPHSTQDAVIGQPYPNVFIQITPMARNLHLKLYQYLLLQQEF
jgi:hypothetical protein